jgi:hypothetical protein
MQAPVRHPSVATFLTLLRSNDNKKSSYITALEGLTRWSDALKSADLQQLRIYASLALAVGLANRQELFDDTDFVRNKDRWGEILEIAESRTDRTEDQFLDLLRNTDLTPPPIGDAMDLTGDDKQGQSGLPPPPTGQPEGATQATSDAQKQMQLFLDALSKIMPSLLASTNSPAPATPVTVVTTQEVRSAVPSPGDLAKNKAVDDHAKRLIEGVNSMASKAPQSTQAAGFPGAQDLAASADPQLSTSNQGASIDPSASRGPINYYINWVQPEDEASPSATLGSRLPVSLAVTSKKKESIWAPRLQTDAMLANPVKDGKTAPLPLMSEYFEAAMRCCDRLRESPGLSDAEFVHYVSYVRWIYKLNKNHTWETVMAYDEAFRTAMERRTLHSWSARPQELEREHLLNRGHSNSQSYSVYSGVKRRSGENQAPEICRNFNKNRCKHGESCVHMHRCSHCKKWGHPVSKCSESDAPKGQSGQDSSAATPGGNRA